MIKLFFNSITDRKKLENWMRKFPHCESLCFNWSVNDNQLTIEKISPYSIPSTIGGIKNYSKKSKIDFRKEKENEN